MSTPTTSEIPRIDVSERSIAPGASTPTTVLRRLAGFGLICAFAGVAVILLWSDRAGAMFGTSIDFIIDAGRSVEARSGINVVDRSQIPGDADQIGHALLWGSGVLLVGWLLRRKVPVSLTALGIAGVSLAFELAQPALSMTRRIESSDVTANLIGITVAATALAIVLGIGRLWQRHGTRHYAHQASYVDEPTDEYFFNL